MYARTENNRISVEVMAVVCQARARNFRAAEARRRIAAVFGEYLA